MAQKPVFIDNFVELMTKFEKENVSFSEFYLKNIDETLERLSQLD